MTWKSNNSRAALANVHAVRESSSSYDRRSSLDASAWNSRTASQDSLALYNEPRRYGNTFCHRMENYACFASCPSCKGHGCSTSGAGCLAVPVPQCLEKCKTFLKGVSGGITVSGKRARYKSHFAGAAKNCKVRPVSPHKKVV